MALPPITPELKKAHVATSYITTNKCALRAEPGGLLCIAVGALRAPAKCSLGRARHMHKPVHIAPLGALLARHSGCFREGEM